MFGIILASQEGRAYKHNGHFALTVHPATLRF
jgi:hypothetical protein